MTKFIACIEKVLYESDTNGYCVVKVKAIGDKSEAVIRNATGKTDVIVTGTFYSPTVGKFISCEGEFKSNPKYNNQLGFSASAILLSRLDNHNFTRDFFESPLFRGAGKQYASIMYDAFGDNLSEVLTNDPLSIHNETGIKKADLIAIITEWQRLSKINAFDNYNFLRNLSLTTEQSVGLLSTFGSKTKPIIIENPYEIMSNQSIGFSTADGVALSMGMDNLHYCRMGNAIGYCMNYFKSIGNIGINLNSVLTMSQKLIKVEREKISDFIETRVDRKTMFLMNDDNNFRFLVDSSLYETEMSCAEQIKRIITAPFQGRHKPLRLDDSFLKQKQLQSIKTALYSKMSIVTGGPGYGKTTVAKSIIESLKQSSNDSGKIVLAAPTGKAAGRLSESTGMEAQTIHSLLGYDESSGFSGKERKILDLDTLLIDEMSMVDLVTFHETLLSLPSHARLILVGDDDQLSSVDVGNVLNDLIRSGVVPKTKLDEVVRRDKDSEINLAADCINNGIMPNLDGNADFIFIEADTDVDVYNECMNLITTTLPLTHGISHRNTLLLSPKWAGIDGVDNFNSKIRDVVNPGSAGKFSVNKYGKTFRVDDVVMQTKNNRDLDISNGDTGVISFISLEKGNSHAIVDFDGKKKKLSINELFSMKLAYALTIHKSQGSEAEAVIIPLSKNHENMLSRELLYTGVTRGKKMVYIVGSKDVLEKSIRNLEKKNRKTFLMSHLQKILPQLPKEMDIRRRNEEREHSPSM